MSLTKALIREQLKKVIDPELGINIVDLGLIYNVSIIPALEPESTGILITMTLTTPGCPLAPEFVMMIKEELSQLKDLKSEQIEVEFTFEPPWHQGMMSEEALAQLGLD